jgi:hypothetical protein
MCLLNDGGTLFAGTMFRSLWFCGSLRGSLTFFAALHAVYIPVISHVAFDVLVMSHGSGKAQKLLEDRGW